MALSDVFLSVISGTTAHTSPFPVSATARSRRSVAETLSREREVLRRCVTYRRAFPMTEIALPALALRNSAVAKWVRDQSVAIDVRSSEDLGVTLAAGIHPAQVTVHPDGLSANEVVFCAANLAVNRMVVNATDQIELLASAALRHRQAVLVRITDVNAPVHGGIGEADDAVGAILDRGRLNLIGLHCDIGAHVQDFLSYPAAIGHMIAEMTRIGRDHGILLTRLSLGGGQAVPAGNWAVQLPELSTEIDESLDDACATLRFPRPKVILSTGRANFGQHAA